MVVVTVTETITTTTTTVAESKTSSTGTSNETPSFELLTVLSSLSLAVVFGRRNRRI